MVDRADNTGAGSTSFLVEVDSGSLSNLVRRFVTNAGVAQGLMQKLESARREETAGDARQKAHHLEVFVHTLGNHRDRFLTGELADILTRLARGL